MFLDRLFKRQDKSSTPRSDPRRRAASVKKTERTVQTRKLHQKIDVSDLRVGMFVAELDKPWEESSFMLQGLHIETTADIADVQRECKHVFVDFNEFSLQKPVNAKGLPGCAGVGSILDARPVEDEFDEAREVHAMASRTISSLFKDVRLGAEIDGNKVKQAVNGCVDSILRNPDASVWLTRIQAKHQETAHHSLNVAALSIVVAKSLGMSPRELEDVGVCGMLHDVGKTGVSNEVMAVTGPLDRNQIAEMRMHTRYGRDILISTKSVMSGAADVAHAHHERVDGTGYPRRLDGDSIPIFAKIVAIAEAYDVMTTRQPYREARSPSDALQELYALRGKQFDEDLVIKFIDSVGIFPPGSIVEMLNGEIGIVLSNTSDKLRPRVILILDALHEPVPQCILDLSQMETDNQGNVYQIKTTHRDGSFGIDVGDFQRAGLRFG